jgi:hypothetical protein
MERKPTGSTRFPCVARRLRRVARGLLFFLLFWLGAGLAGAQAQPAAAGPRLQIAAIELGDYPTIGLNLIATSATSEPRSDLEGLRLWENGVPIADFSLEPVTAGIELFVLLDLSDEWGEAAEGQAAPFDTVQESLLRLAGRNLEPVRDRIWLGVTGRSGVGWAIEAGEEPGALVEALHEVRLPAPGASNGGDPAGLLTLALDAAEDGAADNSRFRAILFFSTATGLGPDRLNVLAERASALQLPLFVGITGAPPAETTLETVQWGVSPTRGAAFHMASAGAADELYGLLAANGTQTQLRYRTNLREDGAYPVRVALAGVEASAELTLAFRPARLNLVLEEGSEIRRVGLAPDSELLALQPVVQTVAVEVSWPDGVPRRLQGATLLVDGEAQPAPVLGGGSALEFDWDIAALGAGSYQLTVQVTDTVGLVATSPPRTVIVQEVRPEPTPTVAPATATPPPAIATRPIAPGVIGIGGAVLLLVGLGLLWLARGRLQPARGEGMDVVTGEAALLLASGERVPVGEALTVGRRDADLVLDADDVAVLHARLALEEGGYWLYDEGSSSGTTVNGERLGLAGRRLRAGDEIRFGQVGVRFVGNEKRD